MFPIQLVNVILMAQWTVVCVIQWLASVCVNRMLKESAVTAANLGFTGSAGTTLVAASVSVLSPTEWDSTGAFLTQ